MAEKIVGERIHKARENAGLSQAEPPGASLRASSGHPSAQACADPRKSYAGREIDQAKLAVENRRCRRQFCEGLAHARELARVFGAALRVDLARTAARSSACSAGLRCPARLPRRSRRRDQKTLGTLSVLGESVRCRPPGPKTLQSLESNTVQTDRLALSRGARTLPIFVIQPRVEVATRSTFSAITRALSFASESSRLRRAPSRGVEDPRRKTCPSFGHGSSA